MFCGQEVGNMTSFAPLMAPSLYTTSSLFDKEVARNGSPPWREDDKDGHYMFSLGENLTSRCNYILPSLKHLHFLIMLNLIISDDQFLSF